MSEALDYGSHYRYWHNESDEHLDKMCAAVSTQIEAYLPEGRRELPVLEIGCGMGFAMAALGRAGFKTVKGVDIDASQIAACKRRNLDVEQITDLEAYLEKHPSEFGLVLMMDVLEHLPFGSQVDVLRRIHSAMIPGGRLIIQVPNANSILASRHLYIDFTHVNSFTEHSIRFALNNARFAKVDVPALENRLPRPSLKPWKLFAKSNRWYLKRWLVRSAWRLVLEAEYPGEDISGIPLSLNLMAIADKDG